MEEIFKTVIGFPDYEISNCGRIKTKSRKLRYVHSKTNSEHFRQSCERFLKIQYNNQTGYKFCQLYKEKKMHNLTIHRLVANSFLENENNFDVVNHKDGNKHNNRIDNLEYCTNAYNHKHATETGLKAKGEYVSTSKLNENTAHAIKWFLAKGYSHLELSKAFNISRASIYMISNNKTWKHVALTNKELLIK